MFDGQEFKLGDDTYTIPPLNLKQTKKYLPILQAMAGEKDIEKQIEAQKEVIQAAMSRNYPNITMGEIEELVDIGNLGKIVLAITGMSGLVASTDPPLAGK